MPNPFTNRAGILLREGGKSRGRDRDLFLSHPLIDAVVLPVYWSTVEPKRGRFDFSSVDASIREWSAAGKSVVITIGLYGQDDDRQWTPSWVLKQRDVTKITFAGGGGAHGAQVTIPAVWKPGFVEKYLAPLVKAAAEHYEDEPAVAYVMPGFGHIGNLTCQPSKGGSAACLKAGWTPILWSGYCVAVMSEYRRQFAEKPLMVKTAGILLRSPRQNNYAAEAALIALKVGQMQACVVHFGLTSDPAEMSDVYASARALLPAVAKDDSRIGMGDDWPLYVPPAQRKGPTEGHDEAFLSAALGNMFRDNLPTTVLFCQEPEFLASRQGSTSYVSAVETAMKNARQKLKDNEARL